MRVDRLLAGLFAVTAVAALLLWTRIGSFERREIVLKNARGMPLRLVVFIPGSGSPVPRPAILVLPPVNSPPEAGLPLILEFTRHGMLAAAIDFRSAAPGESRATLRENVLGVTGLDTAAALAHLAGRADVDPERIGVIGHSFGGTLAIRAAIEQPRVRATVAVGIAGDVTRELPRNLLWLVGLYDQFRPLSEMQQVMEASNREAVATIDYTTGDFARGTARRLGVTATADHFTEFLNHGTAVRAVEWFESAFGPAQAPPNRVRLAADRPERTLRVAAAPWFYACYCLAFLFGWMWLWRRLCRAALLPWWRARTFALAMVALIAALLLLPLPRLALLRADLALWGLALLLAVSAGSGRAIPRRAAWFVPLAWASVVLTLVVNQAAYYWRYPYLLYALPAFPFWHGAGLLNQYLFIYPRAFLFSSYTGWFIRPGWLFLAWLPLEVARPGVTLRGIGALIRRLRPTRPVPAATARRDNWPAWIAVGGLFTALAIVAAMRAAQGFVERDTLLLAGWVILRFAVLPFLVFALLKRLLLKPD